ncbi:MAG: hypothetical protein M1470_06135 [Bacteroidetes bacterium]|nr:hypothetical protein [Bacteroidota bacterium]MCL5738289.1 hypothetical protein [Bacteroidota bacterium]
MFSLFKRRIKIDELASYLIELNVFSKKHEELLRASLGDDTQLDRKRVLEEMQWLSAFSVDFFTWWILGETDRTRAVLDSFYSKLKPVVYGRGCSPTPDRTWVLGHTWLPTNEKFEARAGVGTDPYENLKERFALYTEALRTGKPHSQEINHFQVGFTFAKLCGTIDILAVQLGQNLLLTNLKQLKWLFNTFKIVR